MKIFMIGGTGLLGSEAARQLIAKGHEVTSLSVRGMPDGAQIPEGMKIIKGNYMQLSQEEMALYLRGMDGFVFAAGIDERVNGDYPIYNLFKRFNIDPLEKLLSAAKQEGVKHCVVLGSYFCYFAKQWSDLKLYEMNPYIRSRVDQEEMALSFADETMSVGVLELPYIFGTQPGRKPVWTILVENILSMKAITMFPPGGTTMVTVRQVGECVVGALERTEGGKAYPVGYFNMEWPEMLKIFHRGMGCPDKKILTIPGFLFTLSQKGPYKKMRAAGKEQGLNMVNFSKAMSRNMFIDKSIIVNELGVTPDDIESAMLDSVKLSVDSINGKKLVEMKAIDTSYNFYGWQTADVAPANPKYSSIKNPRELYDLLMKIWCAETCAPRMRDNWEKSHPTYGQCSITAFLAQDIFGGEVYGILREGGNYHCYNVIDDCVFDLTSEQFGDEKLCYENNPVQSRDVHFAKEEKKLRYEYLKAKLDELIK